MLKPSIILALGLVLSACVGGSASERFVRGGGPSTTTQDPNLTGQAPIREVFVAPRVQEGSGLESIIGENARALTGRFGPSRLNRIEGDARKLQFAGETCVLDIYLYPLQAGGTPVATHVEARARIGGGAFDRAQCIQSLASAAR